MVTAHVSYNAFSYDYRWDFIKLSSDKILVPVTIELSNKDLEFKKELDFNRATVNVYGNVTSLTGRIYYEWEDVISVEFSDEFFDKGKNKRSEYQKIIGLPPGQRYKLDLVLKDTNSKAMGTQSVGLNVPKYDEVSLQSSSIILAQSIYRRADKLRPVAAVCYRRPENRAQRQKRVFARPEFDPLHADLQYGDRSDKSEAFSGCNLRSKEWQPGH